MASSAYRWFFAGTCLLALVIGALIGLSASPVVGVTVPLLFALLSAGGALYVVLGGEPPKLREATATEEDKIPPTPTPPATPSLSPLERRQRAAFLGRQLVAFSVGIIPGVWLGAEAKIHSEAIWGTSDRPESALIQLNFTDARDLAATLALDQRLIAAHLPLADRQRLLGTLHQAIAGRNDSSTHALSQTDAASAESILKSLPKEPKPSGEKTDDKQEIGPVAIGPDDPLSAAHTTS